MSPEYANIENLRAAEQMFAAMAALGINVAKHEFVRFLDDSKGAYVVAERLEGIPLIQALVEGSKDVLGAIVDLVLNLATYYQEVLKTGGTFPTDFYDSQFFYGHRAGEESAPYVIDLDPYVHPFEPSSPDEDAYDVAFSQVEALVALLLIIEGLSEKQPAGRKKLAALFEALAGLYPGAEVLKNIAAKLIDGTAAEIRLASSEPADIGGEWEIPVYLRGQRVETYEALLESLEEADIIRRHVRYKGATALVERVIGSPLINSWRENPEAVTATERFIERLAAFLDAIAASGGNYPINVWAKRLTFGRTKEDTENRIYLSDPAPHVATLDKGDAGNRRRFAAFCNECVGLTLDTEESCGTTLEGARVEVKALLSTIGQLDEDLNRKTALSLRLLEEGHRTPISYWIPPAV